MDVIYYHYLLFYKRILKVPEPLYYAMLVLAASQSFLINGLLEIIILKKYCYQIPVWIQFSISIIIIYFNYLTYIKRGKATIIAKQKPLFWNNKPFSFTISTLFFLSSLSWLFWGSIYGKYLLDHCK